jgi:hypothetical protein
MSIPAHIVDIDNVVLHDVDPRRLGEMSLALEAQIARELAKTPDVDGPAIAREATRAVVASASGAADVG